ncbi:MAG TPA: Calx-beta domain-containing protein, partial [Tepidisphaeraceae bacterium]|nr:Calx-beta domain-containing protein [Tepidisphaeraceae bacterium]
QVAGNVILDGALNLNLNGLAPANGQQFTLINNIGVNPVVGQFIGLPQNEIVTIGTHAFVVSYTGGDGNDVVLTSTVSPVISIASPGPVVEGNTGQTTNMVFTVSLSDAIPVDVSVDFATSGVTATSGVDFTPESGTLVIPAGQVTGIITVPIIGDLNPEPNETFRVTLSNAVHGNLKAPPFATGTILDDDGPPVVSFGESNVTVNENSGVATITVIRTNPSVAVTVDYATTPGTATPGVDYTAVSGTLSMGIGVVFATFDVPIIDAKITDGSTRDFTVTLSNPHGDNATLGVAAAVVTINDTDTPPPAVSIADAIATEPISGLISETFTISLDKPSDTPVTVQFTTTGGTATEGVDYVATSGTVTIPAGQLSAQATVPIKTDFTQEASETYSVVLSNLNGDAAFGRAIATGTIQNQDVQVVALDATHPFRFVNSSGNLTVIALRGPGSGEVDFLGQTINDAKQVVLNDTTAQSALIVRTSRLQTFLVNITVNGSIGVIDGPTLNLQSSLTSTGGVGRLRLNTIAGGDAISIGSADGDGITGLTAALGNVTNATFTSALPLRMLRVGSWTDSGAGVDITAPSAAVVAAFGNFQADMAIAGDLGTFRVIGALDNADIRVGGSINALVAVTMSNSTVFAGVQDGVTTVPTSASQFSNNTSTIKLAAVASPAAGAFRNTSIAAPIIGTVLINGVATQNGGNPFGIVGNSIKLTRGHDDRIINVTNASLTANPFTDADLLIKLLT